MQTLPSVALLQLGVPGILPPGLLFGSAPATAGSFEALLLSLLSAGVAAPPDQQSTDLSTMLAQLEAHVSGEPEHGAEPPAAGSDAEPSGAAVGPLIFALADDLVPSVIAPFAPAVDTPLPASGAVELPPAPGVETDVQALVRVLRALPTGGAPPAPLEQGSVASVLPDRPAVPVPTAQAADAQGAATAPPPTPVVETVPAGSSPLPVPETVSHATATGASARAPLPASVAAPAPQHEPTVTAPPPFQGATPPAPVVPASGSAAATPANHPVTPAGVVPEVVPVVTPPPAPAQGATAIAVLTPAGDHADALGTTVPQVSSTHAPPPAAAVVVAPSAPDIAGREPPFVIPQRPVQVTVTVTPAPAPGDAGANFDPGSHADGASTSAGHDQPATAAAPSARHDPPQAPVAPTVGQGPVQQTAPFAVLLQQVTADEPAVRPETRPDGTLAPTVSAPHSLPGDAPAASTAPAVPARTPLPQVTEHVVRTAQFLLREHGGTVQLRLEPEALGRLTVHVMQDHDVVRIELTVQSHQVSEVLHGQLSNLRQQLLDQGLALSELTVSVGTEGRREPADRESNPSGDNSGRGTAASAVGSAPESAAVGAPALVGAGRLDLIA